jgi:hypothetical protein
MLKRLGVAALVLLVLVAGLVGVVLAQDATPAPEDACPYAGTCGGQVQGGRGMRGYGYAGSMPTLLAEALGMTVEELQAAQAGGQTVAEMAAAQGVELADVVAAVMVPRAESLAQAVAGGRLTQEQADAMLATMIKQMTSRFEGTAGYGGGCGMWGTGENGPSGNTGGCGGCGHRGGMMGGRWSAPQAPGSGF